MHDIAVFVFTGVLALGIHWERDYSFSNNIFLGYIFWVVYEIILGQLKREMCSAFGDGMECITEMRA